MTDAKPLASLSPTLLARKGGARPAMRPQQPNVAAFQESAALALEEDLGWNDHGNEAEVIALTPAAAVTQTAAAKVPDVVRQQSSIAARMITPAKPSRRSALDQGRRAAFTLRLDAERHLKLRLACTMRGRSAQQLVIDALDQLIGTVPDLDTLAAQVAKRR